MSPWEKSVEKLFSDVKLHLGKSKSVCNVEKLICEYWNTNKWSSFYMSVLVKFHCIIFRQLLCYIFFVTAGTFRYIFKFRICLTTFDLHLSHLHLMVVQVAWQSLFVYDLCNCTLFAIYSRTSSSSPNTILNIFSINKARRYANYSIFALIIIFIPLAISFLFMSSPHK